MVCPRCIESVKDSMNSHGIPFLNVSLGEIELANVLSTDQKDQLKSSLEQKGFEILEEASSTLIAKIKSLIIDQVHHSKEKLNVNFSTFLSEKLAHDYSYLSHLFSSIESVTIEKFITAQRIERVKELLIYDQLTLSQIAYSMNYSSVAHLSAQFKKETGLTPTEFKRQQNPLRRSLDKI